MLAPEAPRHEMGSAKLPLSSKHLLKSHSRLSLFSGAPCRESRSALSGNLTHPPPEASRSMLRKSRLVGLITLWLCAPGSYSGPNSPRITRVCGPPLPRRASFFWTEYGVFRGRMGVFHLKSKDFYLPLHKHRDVCVFIMMLVSAISHHCTNMGMSVQLCVQIFHTV